MPERTLSPKEVRQLQKRYQELQSEIAQLGWIAQGGQLSDARRRTLGVSLAK